MLATAITDEPMLNVWVRLAVAVHALGALHPVQVAVEADRGVGRPVVPRPEVQVLAAVPVPGADHRLGRGELQRPLDRGPVGDRLAEGQHDRHADAVGLVGALEDLGAGRSAPGVSVRNVLVVVIFCRCRRSPVAVTV